MNEEMNEQISDDFRSMIFNKKKSDMTNAEFLYCLMEIGGKTGAMKQLFIMDGLPKWCRYIIENEEAVLKQMEGSMVHGPAWIGAAKEIADEFEKMYEAKV
jgi:hypothetical protein